MKTDIHPNYVDATIVCSCGNEVKTRSTKSDIHVEICSSCHPFYTGKQKLMDTGGRLARFQAKVDTAGSEAAGRKKKKANVRTFTPAADPKVLAAKQARAEAKALEDAKQRKAAEEAAKAEAEAAKLEKEKAEAEAIVAAGDPATTDAPAAETPTAEAPVEEAPTEEAAATEAPVEEAPAADEAPAEDA